jgi:galactokinase
MTGGGFGGCTINLLKPGAIAAFEAAMHSAYRERFQIDPVFYHVEAAEGASEIWSSSQ